MIYLLNQESTTLYKIGKTKNITRRIKQLQTGAAFDLRLSYSQEVNPRFEAQIESTLHRRYNSYKTKGEWFDFDTVSLEDVISTIKTVVQSVTDVLDANQEEISYI